MVSIRLMIPLMVTGVMLLVPPVRAAEPIVGERVKEEASRPLRWIIESGNMDRRRKEAKEAAAAEEAARARVRRVARPAESSTRSAERVPSVAVAPRESVVTIAMPSSSASATVVPVMKTTPTEAVAAAAASLSTPRQADAPAPHLASVGSLNSSTGAVAGDQSLFSIEEPLVPLSQDAPEIWRGYCPDRCDRYFYRVAFVVQPSGKVSDVRVLETNFQKFKSMVVNAVSNWRYKPLSSAQEEEVTLRIASH